MPNKLKKAGSILFSMILALMLVITMTSFYFKLQGKQMNLFGFRVITIVSGSMEPTLHPGDFILSKEVNPASVTEGTVISFLSEDPEIYREVNTHRVVGIVEEDGKTFFITRGDANPGEDSYRVPAENLVGVTVCKLRLLTFVYSLFRTPLGFVFLIVLPMGWIIFSQILEMVRSARKDPDPIGTAIAQAGMDPRDPELRDLVARFGVDILREINPPKAE